MIKKILFILVLLTCPLSYSTTIYMGSGETYTNLEAAVAAMSGGDTLIIRDGTYTGATNILDSSHLPPSGTAENYTIIKAEHDGSVIFSPFIQMDSDVERQYIQIEGIQSNEGTVIIGWDYYKIKRCFFEDSKPGVDNSATVYLSYGSYALVEDSASWGSGRYKWEIRSMDHVVMRRAVARHDIVISTLPSSVFGSYSSDYVIFQNCIVIDSDTSEYWTYMDGQLYGAFGIPHAGTEIHSVGSIAINNELSYGSGAITDANASIINSLSINNLGGVLYSGFGFNVDHFTVINSTGSTPIPNGYGVYGYSSTPSVTNSIINGCNIAGVRSVVSDYNSFYNNTANYASTSTGANDFCTENSNGFNQLTTDILYPVKIENGGALDGTASDSGDIGATILYRTGSDGTLWDDTGWNTLTAIKMWPFPNEELIRSKMAAYTWDDGSGGDPEITGARGFATTSLTGYILNYLEPTNTITVTSNVTSTDDVNEYIYGESGETDEVDPIVAISDSDPKTLTSGYTTTLGFTSSDASGIDECKWRSGSAPDESNGTLCTGSTSGTCSVTGLVQRNNTIYVGCADPSNNWGSDSIVVNAPSYRAQAGGSFNIR